MRIDAKGVCYRELNELIRRTVDNGEREIVLDNVNGQRYIGDGLSKDVRIIIKGIPGNDLAAFMDGPTIVVNSNGQDGIGNTMNGGKIIVHGDVGDIAGHSMRGGNIYIRGNAGYRTGIHMKSYKDLYPVIIIGDTAGDFLGEYMAGGLIIVLGLDREKNKQPAIPAWTADRHNLLKGGHGLSTVNCGLVGNHCGTGMHGGTMYIRGDIEDYQLGEEVKKSSLNREDGKMLRKYLKEYSGCFSLNLIEIMNSKFIKLSPSTRRPYGKLYAY